jgi:hypothetical protein
MHTEWSKKAFGASYHFCLFLHAQAWDGYEDIRYEELYIGDYDNDK